jgi:hypothetical protein
MGKSQIPRRWSETMKMTTAGGSARMMIPSGTEAARAFIPAKDFDLSKDLMTAIGTESGLGRGTAFG